MSKANGELFRKSMSGYNKDDVNEYIEAASIRAKKREEEYESHIHSLEEKLEALEERVKVAESRDFSEEEEKYKNEIASIKSYYEITLEEQKAMSQKSVEELAEKISEGNKLIQAQNEYIERLKDGASKLQSELEASREMLDGYEKRSENASAVSEKASKYDSISAQIGDLMLNAGNTAEHIINEAKSKAAQIVANADKRSNEALYVLKKYTEKYCERLGEVTVASANERLNRIHSEMAEFEASLNRSIAEAKSTASPMNIHIESLRNSLEASIDTILGRNFKSESETPLEEKEANRLLERAISDILSNETPKDSL